MNRTIWILAIICLVISVCFVAINPTRAIEPVSAEPIGLTLSPLRTELTIEPGTRIEGILSITNTTDKKMTVSLEAESFRVTNDQYDYAFDKETEITKWVNFEHDSIELEKGQSTEESYSIGVPISTEPTGRYLSLFASYDTVSNGSEATVSRQRVGSLLYITISGDVTRHGSILNLTSPAYIDGSNSQWSTSIRNSGTTHFRSRYSVSIESLIGSGSVATTTGNALILPGTIRQVTDALPLPKLPGIYKVVYTIGLGDTPAVTETRFIIYIPTVVIVFASVAIILIISLLTQKVRKRKSNQSEEQQYKRQK